MQLGVQLPEASGMFAGVVTAEEQLSSGRENGPHRGGGAAAVAAVVGGQGRRSGEGCVHDDLPSSGPFGERALMVRRSVMLVVRCREPAGWPNRLSSVHMV